MWEGAQWVRAPPRGGHSCPPFRPVHILNPRLLLPAISKQMRPVGPLPGPLRPGSGLHSLWEPRELLELRLCTAISPQASPALPGGARDAPGDLNVAPEASPSTSCGYACVLCACVCCACYVWNTHTLPRPLASLQVDKGPGAEESWGLSRAGEGGPGLAQGVLGMGPRRKPATAMAVP